MGFSFKAMWNNKCPKCRQGDIFVKPFNFKDPVKMPERCSYCNQATQPEPGFYYGAMFLSYIFTGWYLLAPALLLVFYFGWTVTAAMVFVIFLAAVSYIKILRGARLLWFHMMVKHDPAKEAEVKQKLALQGGQKWTPGTKAG